MSILLLLLLLLFLILLVLLVLLLVRVIRILLLLLLLLLYQRLDLFGSHVLAILIKMHLLQDPKNIKSPPISPNAEATHHAPSLGACEPQLCVRIRYLLLGKCGDRGMRPVLKDAL